MKFDYCKENFSETTLYPQYHFQFTLDENEVRRVLHKYDLPNKDTFMMDVFEHKTDDKYFQMLSSLELIRENLSNEKIDLGINYKKKYDELVELLEPHKIDETMEPVTTLKMILRYNK